MAHAEATGLRPAVAVAARRSFGLTYTRVGRRLHRRALRARPRRGGQLSRRRSRRWPNGSRSGSARSRPGIFNAGTNIGALVTPLVVPWITLTWGWYWAFIATGALGFLWLALVVAALPTARAASARQRGGAGATSSSDPPSRRRTMPWRTLLPHRQTWAFAVGKFMTDPIWWLYLFWMPDFLNRNYGLDLHDDRAAAGRDLSDRRRRQHRRRLAVVVADQARLDA